MRTRFKKRSRKTGRYKSKLESLVAKKLGKRATYETVHLSYYLPKRYTPDFVIVADNDHRIYLEVKGWYRYEDQVKMRAVKASHPELDIRMYFPNDSKVQASKLTNSQWCEKYGFPYYIGEISHDLL